MTLLSRTTFLHISEALIGLAVIGIVTGPDLNIDFPSLYQEQTALAFESKTVHLYLSSIVRTELTSFWKESLKEEKPYIVGNVHSHEDEGKLAFKKM